VQGTTTRPKIIVTADGAVVVSHAGSRLLADVADRTTLSGELSQVLELAHRSHVGTVGQRCRGRTQYGFSA
jgi:hypothetical protein